MPAADDDSFNSNPSFSERFAKLMRSPKMERSRDNSSCFRFSPLWEQAHASPIVREIQKAIHRLEEEAILAAKVVLFEAIGRLSEDPKVYAHLSAIYLVLPGDRLMPVALHNHLEDASCELTSSMEGVVARAARQGEPIYEPDVSKLDRRDYRRISQVTKSEYAIPIFWKGELLGVINLESRKENGMALAGDVVNEVIPSLIMPLLVLRSCYATNESWLPWNPMIHGWDLRKTLSQLLQILGQELASVSAKLSIWYPDWEKECVFAYAVYGYDWAYVNGRSLHLHKSQIGKSLKQSGKRLVQLNIERFINKSKAADMAIDEAWAAPIHPGDILDETPLATLTCYFSNPGRKLDAIEKNDRELSKEAIGVLAKYLGFLIQAYKVHRQEYASAYVASVNFANRNNERGTRFEEWLTCLRSIFEAPAGSVFGYRKSRGILQCVATTGFHKNPTDETSRRVARDFNLKKYTYNLLDDHKSHAREMFLSTDTTLRRLNVGHPQEKGLPEKVPIVADQRVNSEFIPGQPLHADRPNARQLLGRAFFDKGVKKGIVRLIRQTDKPPFTVCDAKLLETLSKSHAPAAKKRVDSAVRQVNTPQRDEAEYRI